MKSEEETYTFMSTADHLLADQRRVHRVDAVHLCLAGGRKDMAVTAALVSTYFGVNGVYHVIMPDIQVVNQRLELLRKDIEMLASSDDPIAFYNSRSEDFDPLMFSPMGDYKVIKIPTIPYPLSMLRKVRHVLANGKVEKGATGLPEDVLEGLWAAGLVRITSKGTVYVTDTGKRIHDISWFNTFGKTWTRFICCRIFFRDQVYEIAQLQAESSHTIPRLRRCQ